MPKFIKIILVVSFSIICQIVFSQTNWTDQFNDSNFTTTPKWEGDSADFMVNAQKQLQLNAPATSSTRTLYTPSTAALAATWEFWVKLDFNPSSSNYAEVYLMSSTPTKSQNQEGYFVQIGGSTTDNIKLIKKENNQNTTLITSTNGLLNKADVELRIKVERDAQHNWNLFVDTLGTSNFNLIGTATDSSIALSAYLLAHCNYTSTRSTKFYFDDFVVTGKIYVDSIKPVLQNFAVPDSQTIRLFFSEAIDTLAAADLNNYFFQSTSNALASAAVSSLSPKIINLTFQQAFYNEQSVVLLIKNLPDLANNYIKDTTIRFTFFKPKYRSIVINEIMADPAPVVGLPDVEYIELYNNTLFSATIENWKLVADEDTILLPTFTIQPYNFALILGKNDSAFYDTINRVFINKTNWLKNDGEPLVLLDEHNVVIDAIEYAEDFYNKSPKADGGWSLEQIQAYLPCTDFSNWSPSKHALGGTPGSKNSPEFNFKAEQTALFYATFINQRSIKLTFTNGLNNTVKNAITSSLSIEEIIHSVNQNNEVTVNFKADIGTQNVSIYIADMPSCQSRFLADTLVISSPQAAKMGDVVLNEILFEPKDSGTDFIEIWNISDKTINLSTLRIATLSQENLIQNQYHITDEIILFPAKSFLAISTDYRKICTVNDCPNPKSFFNIKQMPSMPNTEGNIALVTPDLQIIEHVPYQSSWHHPVLNVTQGVSLERIHPSLPAEKPNSWHSAGSSANYATPGKINSQFSSMANNEKIIWLNNNFISPNNDGQNDLLIVYYDLPIGTALTLKVFGTDGNLIHTIAENYLTDQSRQIIWHGQNNMGQIASSGIYLILAEWQTPDGTQGGTKLNVSVSR